MDVKGVQAGSLTEYRADWEKMLWISVNSYDIELALPGFDGQLRLMAIWPCRGLMASCV